MRGKTNIRTGFLDSIVLTGIGIAAIYWILESFMFFFLSPEANVVHHLLGEDMFETLTRVLVLCMFLIFGSHIQYSVNRRREADRAMRQQDEKYRTIVENIKEGFLETDLSGNFTFFNHSICKILGYSGEELIGMNNREYTNSQHSKRLNKITDEVCRTGEPAQVKDFEVIRKDGSTRAVEFSLYLIKDNKSKPAGFRGVVRDVTEIFQAEIEKRKLEKQLQHSQKMEAIGNLAGGIAHDFNNVLMGMQGNASLMLFDIDESHPHYNKIKNIERYVENGSSLTRQLLGFSKGEGYAARTIDLNELIKRTSSMFGRAKKEIKIHTDLLKKIWTVEVNQGQMEMVFLNLYINALHAMPEGGDLHLLSENVVIDEGSAKNLKLTPGEFVKVSVVDTGSGMDREIQEKIFDPFFTTKDKGRGTGLGLASASEVIKNHGGLIDVYSEKGKGATFNIYLPASDKEVIQEEELTRKILKGTETILLVDDEEMILEVNQEILKALGYKAMIAEGWKEAVEIFKNHREKIHMVIMDMIIPGMSGKEFYDRLKETDPKIKVLLSSGYSINSQAAEILERGCNEFIQKPFKMKELSVKIREVLDGK
ncbi:MAG: PAS domain S-box protein [Thermodesulfobacteriota bacterium]|nr:PAS domain S-box protein [Thermodesulfobacteriota bacterium]